MTQKMSQIFQFKIKLRGITPMIWRRVQVHSFITFYELHTIIQKAMGWHSAHLHEFTMMDPKTGTKSHIGDTSENAYVDDKLIDQNKAILDRYFSNDDKKCLYTYDFGDDWEHDIVLEKILDVDQSQKYPRCIAGKRACPPEDCGGIWGYEHLLSILSDPSHEEYDDMLEWHGEINPEDYDPLEFDRA